MVALDSSKINEFSIAEESEKLAWFLRKTIHSKFDNDLLVYVFRWMPILGGLKCIM